MAQKSINKVATVLREYGEKMASKREKSAMDAHNGSPDRMTTADGQGGITASKGTIPTDSGEADVKADMPNDGSGRSSVEEPSGGPDRLTNPDGQGGITASPGTIPTDSGEADVKKDMPADGDTRKSATISARVTRIRQALKKEASPDTPADTKVDKPAAAQTKSATEPVENPNANLSENMSKDTLAKIATTILSTDAGVQFAHNMIEKKAGEAAAHEQMSAAIQAAQSYDESEIIKSAAYDHYRSSLNQVDDQLTEIGVSEQDADSILKQASVHQKALHDLDHPMLKQAYAQGMDDAALLASADEAAGAEGAPPVDEAMPMGGEELGEEEIMALLAEMIESGEITEEEVLAALEAEGMGAEGGGEIPVEAPPAELAEEPAVV